MRTVCLFVFCLIAFVWSPAAERQPNILFILADDLGWSALSCYGNRDVATPNLDRLAAQGMRFTHAYADAQCSPSRGALLSGQYGGRTGLFKVIAEKEPPKARLLPPEPRLALGPEVADLAQTLRSAGYATGLSGKWHIADNHVAANLARREGGKYFDRYGFDFCGKAKESDHAEDKAVTAITDDIIGFIRANQSKPWFAYVAHVTTHTKLTAPAALVDKHSARGFKRTVNPGAKFSERPTAQYLAMLEHLDDEVGRLLASLEELGLSKDTIVVFTSDNGGLSRTASNAPLREGKGSPYEGGIRVPLIVRWPGQIKPATTCGTSVHFVDFYPTFATVSRAAAPAHPLDGEGLLHLWRQDGELKRRELFWHMPTYTANYGRTPCAVIRQDEWKLIHWFGDYLDPKGLTPDARPYGRLVLGPRTELYNLREDPGETRDLAQARPQKTQNLLRRLEIWRKEVGAKTPTENPAFDLKEWWYGATEGSEATK
jgi:uncharacterized sulfatase